MVQARLQVHRPGACPWHWFVEPAESGPVFDYLYTRQLDSLEASNFGAVREMLHMMVLDPYESDGRETSHYFGGITRSINAGQPVPLLLVEALNPSQVFDNHQVLATGYFYRGGPQGQLVVQVYDPNFPGRFMYLNTHNTYNDEAQYPSEIETYDAAGSEYSGLHFYGFFTTPYSYVAPPWALAKPTGNLINDPGADWTDSTWNLTTSTGGAPPGSIETPSSELGQPAGGTSVIAHPIGHPQGVLPSSSTAGRRSAGRARTRAWLLERDVRRRHRRRSKLLRWRSGQQRQRGNSGHQLG